jgi:hypothetical protein
VLRAVDEGYRHLIGIAPLQLWVAIDINHPVRLADLGTDSCDLRYRLLTQMAVLPGQYDDPLTPLCELDHGTIFHDAGDVAAEGRGCGGQSGQWPTELHPRRGTVASRVAPPNIMVAGMSTGTGAITARISAGVSLIRQTLERMPDQV